MLLRMDFYTIYKLAASFQISTAFISLIASSVLVISIFRSDDSIKTPYKRLICSISFSDILQSCGLLVGPFMTPTSVSQAFWSVGNEATCVIDGLIFSFGSTWVPMYSAALSIYYYCKLYKHMTDDQFYYKVERKMHIFIILFMVTLNILALSKKTFNTATSATLCTYAATPLRCRYIPSMDCDANAGPVKVLSTISTLVIPFTCLVVIIVCLSLISWQITIRERIFSNQQVIATKACDTKNKVVRENFDL